MNELQTFIFDENEIRTILIDDEPYFVAKDVAYVLGYSNPRDAVNRHVDNEDKGVRKLDTLGGIQEMTIINESGLYSLVFGSHLPSAKTFKHWVTSEVLPEIRKTGGYGIPKTRAEALRLAADLEEQNTKLLLENNLLKPKAEFYDCVADSKTAIPMEAVAKTMGIHGIGRNNLFKILRDKKILKENNLPYQEFVDRGYFRVVESKYTKASGETCIYIKTLVYQKGVDYIRKLILSGC